VIVLGQIAQVGKEESFKEDNVYQYAMGVKNYGANGSMRDVYGAAKKMGWMQLDIGKA